MKITDIIKAEWTTYVGLLTIKKKNLIVGQEYTTDSFFNPIQDINLKWVISIEEMEYCTNVDYLWVKNLDLIISEPKVQVNPF